MQLIFDKDAANELREKHTVLELETITHPEHGSLTAWCVVPLESVYTELSDLNENIKTHEQLVTALQSNQPDIAKDLCENLKGRFGGELDTFYQVILERIDATGSCVHIPVVEET